MEREPKQNRIVKKLPYGWESRLGLNGRVYYRNNTTQSVEILPPPESWSCRFGLPYGWELGQDGRQFEYFINHTFRRTTYDDPRSAAHDSCATSSDAPHPRQYTLIRDEDLGYGFIAGSDKPIIVRSVTPNGPADGKLLSGDQIIKIGDEFVANSPRNHVLDSIKKSKSEVTLTVIQPEIVLNSCFLKPNKKHQKGMNRHKVRFSEGEDEDDEESTENLLLISPGVLQVVLEEGEPLPYNFDDETTAGDVLKDICKKLRFKEEKLYSLVLKSQKPRSALLEESFSKYSDDILIRTWESVPQIVSNPTYKHYHCHLRLAFVPKDLYQLLREDPESFNYLYRQCVNDVVSGAVYHEDLSSEELFRLASLHILVTGLLQEEKSFTSSSEASRSSLKKKPAFPLSKFNLKYVEKEFGLEKFLPKSMIELFSSNSKERRKMLQHHIKVNHGTYVTNQFASNKASPTSSPSSPSYDPISIQTLLSNIKMQYIKYLWHYHMYGGKYFDATILAMVESDIILLVGHHYGVGQLIDSKGKSKMSSKFGDFLSIDQVEVAPYKASDVKTNVRIEFKDMAPLVVSMHPQSAMNLASVISGYCRVHGNKDVMFTLPTSDDNSAPDYHGPHDVKPSDWNYPPDIASSSINCDFSDPSNFPLSEEIPISIRSMFQQSRDVQDDERSFSSMEDESEDSSDVETNNQASTPPQVDEGVAMAVVDVSPKSSVSSVVCTSPSSGIGSVTSHNEREQSGSSNTVTYAVIRKSKKSYTSAEENWDDSMGVEEANNSENEDENLHHEENVSHVQVDVVDGSSEVALDEDVGEKEEHFEPSSVGNEKEDQLRKISSTESQSTSVFDQTPPSRSRFSSFKPNESPITNSSNSPSIDHRTSFSASSEGSSRVAGGKFLTSEEFQRELRKESSVSSPQIPVIEEDSDDALTSPFPVEDLAKGHKDLKNGRKSRFSWGGSRKKNRFQFRNPFSTRRTYSMKKSFSLDGEQQKKKRWSWFGFFRSSSTPTKKTRFSLFKSLNRKKRSHDLQTSSSGETPNGAYSVFEARDAGKRVDLDALKSAASYQDISLREREVVEDKPRPVSFLTFQQLSSATDVDEDDESNDDLSNDTFLPSEDRGGKKMSTSSEQSSLDNNTDAQSKSVKAVSVTATLSDSSDNEEDSKLRSYSNPSDISSSSFANNQDEVVTSQKKKQKRKAPTPPSLLSSSSKILPPTLSDTREDSESSVIEQEIKYEDYRLSDDELEKSYDYDVSLTQARELSERDEVVRVDIDHESISSDSQYSFDDNSQHHVDVNINITDHDHRDKDVDSESLHNESSTQFDEDDTSSEKSSFTQTEDLKSEIISSVNARDTLQNDESDDNIDASQDEDEHEDIGSAGHEIVFEVNQSTALSTNENGFDSDSNEVIKDYVERKDSDDNIESVHHQDNVESDDSEDTTASGYHQDVSVPDTKEQPQSFHDYIENTVETAPSLTFHANDDENAQNVNDDNHRDENLFEDRNSEDKQLVEKTDFISYSDVNEKPIKLNIDADGLEESSTSSASSTLDDNDDRKLSIDNTNEEESDPFASKLNRLLNGLDKSPVLEKADKNEQEEKSIKERVISESDPNTESKDVSGVENGVEKVTSFVQSNVSAKPYSKSLTTTTKQAPIRFNPKILPPKPFNIPASTTNGTAIENRSKQENSSFVSRNTSEVTNDVLQTQNGIAKPVESNTTNIQTSTNDDEPKPNRDMYHNLIAPRLFGQKWEKKSFSPIKPPISNPSVTGKNTPSRLGVIKSVPYPTSHRNGRPPVAPKPNLLQQQSG